VDTTSSLTLRYCTKPRKKNLRIASTSGIRVNKRYSYVTALSSECGKCLGNSETDYFLLQIGRLGSIFLHLEFLWEVPQTWQAAAHPRIETCHTTCSHTANTNILRTHEDIRLAVKTLQVFTLRSSFWTKSSQWIGHKWIQNVKHVIFEHEKKTSISRHILHQHWYTCPTALPVRRNPQHRSFFTIFSATCAPPFHHLRLSNVLKKTSRPSREPLYATNSSHRKQEAFLY
jgi:hypothetical protein